MNKQKEYEKRIAKNFLCQLSEGWIISDDKSESPDFVLSDGARTVGLELTSYREQGAHNEADSRDRQLRRFIYDRWCKDEFLNHFHLFLVYRKSNGRFLLPHKNRWNKLSDELRSLVHSLDFDGERNSISIKLLEQADEELEKFLTKHQESFRTVDIYPVLCHHFEKVVVRYYPDLFAGEPSTSASSMNTGADVNEVKRVLNKKIKNVDDYRSNLPKGAELWLLIHSDGWPMTANVSIPSILETLLQTAESILRSSGEFARAYWLNDADTIDQCALYPVYPHRVSKCN